MSKNETDPLLPLSLSITITTTIKQTNKNNNNKNQNQQQEHKQQGEGEDNNEYIRTHGFSFGVALAFSINFSMGAGFLSLPWAFNQAGLLLSIIIMLIVAIPLYIAILFNLEAMSRASIVDKLMKSPSYRLSNELLVVGDERFEVSDLCSLFVGKWTKFSFLAILSIYSYGCLWSYCAVFSSAMSSTFPLGENIDSYVIYLIVYAAIVIPLTCLEVTEQIYVQVFLAFCRLAVVLFMVGTVILGFESNPELFDTRINTYNSDFKHFVNFNSLHIILPIATFAFIFTHNVPVISEPVEDKKKLHWIYLLTIIVCFIGYSSIGVMVSFYFGENILSSCNLNWSSPTLSLSSLPISNRLIALYIIIFPALDVISAFPLNAITLGSIIIIIIMIF